MDAQIKQELIAFLSGFVAEKRLDRFNEVLSQRTAHLQVVLENLFQAHNASAVMRSCDCFGVQHVHFIENRNRLRITDEIAMGSSKWLSIHRYNSSENNTIDAIRSLKKQGFRIVATSPHKNDLTIDQLPVDKKLALVFGTELEGISNEILSEADEFVKIPMMGFTESFNVSVCAALCMYELTTRIRQEVPNHGLSEQEKTDVYLEWLKSSIDNSEALVSRFFEDKKRSGNAIGS